MDDTDTLQGHGDVAHAIAAGAAMAEPRFAGDNLDGKPYVVLPEKYRIHDLEPMLSAPMRKRGNTVLTDVPSFISFCLREGTGDIFGSREQTSLTAVFNGNTADGGAGWGDHRATYSCPMSREWKEWIGQNARPMSQEAFAQFIEDHLDAIDAPPNKTRPTASDMLLLARSFEAKQKVEFQSGVRLDSGDVDLTFVEKTEATAGKGKIPVPEAFYVVLRVFEEGKAYKLKARLRYRITDGRLSLWYDLEAVDEARERAFNEVWSEVKKELGEEFGMFFGTPAKV